MGIIFLDLEQGMTVVVQHDFLTGEAQDKDWWMGLVLHTGGGARDPRAYTLFQIADVDSGEIRWVNADLVTHVLPRPGRRGKGLGIFGFKTQKTYEDVLPFFFYRLIYT